MMTLFIDSYGYHLAKKVTELDPNNSATGYVKPNTSTENVLDKKEKIKNYDIGQMM